MGISLAFFRTKNMFSLICLGLHFSDTATSYWWSSLSFRLTITFFTYVASKPHLLHVDKETYTLLYSCKSKNMYVQNDRCICVFGHICFYFCMSIKRYRISSLNVILNISPPHFMLIRTLRILILTLAVIHPQFCVIWIQ